MNYVSTLPISTLILNNVYCKSYLSTKLNFTYNIKKIVNIYDTKYISRCGLEGIQYLISHDLFSCLFVKYDSSIFYSNWYK